VTDEDYTFARSDAVNVPWTLSFDADALDKLVKATVADHLNLTVDTPNVVRLRDGKRVIASIRRRRVATFPPSS